MTTAGPAYDPPSGFTTARLRLRASSPDDANELFDAYASDPEVTRFLSWPTRTHADQVREFLVGLDQRRGAGEEHGWVLQRRDGGQLVGMVTVRVGAHGLELGYVLAREHWGRGLMSEAVGAVVEDAVAQPGVFRVWAYHDVDNRASGRVMAKAGLRHETVLRRWVLHPNVSSEPRDAVLYSWVRE